MWCLKLLASVGSSSPRCGLMSWAGESWLAHAAIEDPGATQAGLMMNGARAEQLEKALASEAVF